MIRTLHLYVNRRDEPSLISIGIERDKPHRTLRVYTPKYYSSKRIDMLLQDKPVWYSQLRNTYLFSMCSLWFDFTR